MIVILSLDKKIFDSTSAVAQRMVMYGKTEPMAIFVPNALRESLELSSDVHVESSGGGNKVMQFFSLYRAVSRCIKEHAKDIAMISSQDPFFLGLLALFFGRQRKISVEIQLHGDYFSSSYYRKGSCGNRLRYWIARYVVPRANRVRVVGERVRRSVLALGVSEEKIIVRPVPVDAEAIRRYVPRFDLHKRYPQYAKIFLALGRLDPVKNLAWLIDLFADVSKTHPDWGLVIVGDGPELSRLTMIANQRMISHIVQFEKWTNDPWSYLKTADCLLYPSISEGYGLVPVEAAAVGTPIIMTDIGVAGYELRSGPRVTIVPVGDRDAFIHAFI